MLDALLQSRPIISVSIVPFENSLACQAENALPDYRVIGSLSVQRAWGQDELDEFG
jgi:hypothetical protein